MISPMNPIHESTRPLRAAPADQNPPEPEFQRGEGEVSAPRKETPGIYRVHIIDLPPDEEISPAAQEDPGLPGTVRVSSIPVDIDIKPGRPAFIHCADLNDDGSLEIIVSKFDRSSPVGTGRVDIYTMEKPGDMDTWKRETLDKGIRFPNAPSTVDINGDGKKDILVPSGFLASWPVKSGAISWYENTPEGWKKHEITKGQEKFYHHAELVDMDGDSIKDLVTVAEQKGVLGKEGSEVQVFKGTGTGDCFQKVPVTIAPGLGGFPSVLDINGDGRLDIASAEYFGSEGSFAWLENKGGGEWEKHYIDDKAGKAIQLSFIPDFYGDGVTRAVGANHTNTSDDPASPESAVFVYDIPADPAQPWPKRQISSGIKSVPSLPVAPMGAPGVFHWGDVDGDGDVDIVVSGDGDPRVYLLEQKSPGIFETLVRAHDLPQAGVAVADLDGDGRDEIIASSYQNNRLLIFSHEDR